MEGQKLLLTPQEANRESGVGLNRIYEELHAGRLGHVKCGNRYKIPRGCLLEWIDRQTVRAS